MRSNRFNRRDILTLATALPFATSHVHAQADWPNRPIRMVVPYSAGGAADTSARAMCQRLADILKVPVTVENRTGGNAVVAATAVLGAPKDGHTFIWDAAVQLTNPVLVKDLAFDYSTAFAPVSLAARAPQALLVRADFPAKTFDEFLAVVRSKPGSVSCGTPPSGGMGHLAAALLQQRANIKLIHTPYRGGADASRDVMGGQIDSAIFTTSTARGALATGKVRMLAVTSASRLQAFPDAPTIAERGFAGYDMDDWFGVFAASGTPADIVKKMQDAMIQVAREPALVAAMAPLGLVLVANTSAEFSSWLGAQRGLLHKLIRDTNITLS